MIIILSIFKRWVRRIDFQVWLNNERMRQIETVLEMWKNWRVRGLDLRSHVNRMSRNRNIFNRFLDWLCRDNRDNDESQLEWNYLLPNQRDYIQQLYERHQRRYRRPTTEGCLRFNCIFPILMALWAIVIVMEALTYCPVIYPCLLN